MTRAQRVVLRSLDRPFFPGYCDLMQDAGLTSYTAVDWVLDALERRALIARNDHSDGYDITDAGRAALAAAGQPS
jgi:hypothetical protein